MSNNRPLTTGQAADYCHVSQATIVNWIKDGKLNGYTTPGGHYRIPQSDLVSFLRQYDMPIHRALEQAPRPRLLLVSDDTALRGFTRTLGENGGFDVSLTSCDYEASAEAVRLKPDAAVIEAGSCLDPLGLCRWLTEREVAVLMIGEDEARASAEAAGADAYLSPDDVPSLETTLQGLLR
jgi:excisionase family DNA binding protein